EHDQHLGQDQEVPGPSRPPFGRQEGRCDLGARSLDRRHHGHLTPRTTTTMALKTFRPTSPGLRSVVQIDRRELWKGSPIKSLTEGLKSTGGRNNHGHITTRHRGGGHAKRYRVIDFKRRKFDVAGTVERIEYDPNRTAFIALVKYTDGKLAYILAPQRLAIGDQIVSGERVDIKPGNTLPMRNIPVGTIIHNVEMKPGR